MIAGRTPSALASRSLSAIFGFVALICTIAIGFAVSFPTLGGHILDQANIISVETRSSIELKLADLEAKWPQKMLAPGQPIGPLTTEAATQ